MCLDSNEIITVGNTGSDGWSPVLALYEGTCSETAVTVQQLVSWIDGSGTKPDYNGDIMTDPWLAANPIYIGATGFVTDICDAVPLGGSAGTPGATGPTGPEGPEGPPGEPGCTPIAHLTFEFTNNGEALDPAVEYTVNIDDTDPCAPIYSVSIDANDLFTNTGLVDALTSTTTFTNIINDLPALNPTITSKTTSDPSPLQIGTSTEDIKYTITSGDGVLSFQTGGGISFVDYNIVGNKMYLNFRLLLQVSAGTSGFTLYSLEMKIPGGYTRAVTRENNAISACIPGGFVHGGFPAGIISTNSTASNYLRLGIVGSDGTIIIALQNSTLVSLHGQITFTIN